VVAIAMIASLTVLPGVLAWLGDRVEKGSVKFLRRKRGAGESRFWASLAARVMRRPGLAIALSAGLLIALAIPSLRMNLVVSGPEDLPQDLEIIKTYNAVKESFPEKAIVVDVAVEAQDVTSPPVAKGIQELEAQAATTGGVLPGTETTVSKDKSVALVSIPTVGNGNDDPSFNVLDSIRNEVIPQTIGKVPGTTVNVSGGAAQSADFRDLLNERLPLIIGFVFILTFILLLATFRSIVIPIKAILLNLLSVGAAYGVLVLIFQDGRLEGLLGFTSNGGVTSWLPLFLFVILFGLSMDYHVFLLSRVRESYLGGMKTEEAVEHALKTTAGTITSAAIVMVAVFSVFIVLTFLDFKEMGVGLAVAILIDATIVRGILLPASMKVLGDWNWYLPSWLNWIPTSKPSRVGGPATGESAG
jgi:RND superfamily putative drug exporter